MTDLEEIGAGLWLAEGAIVDFYRFPYPTRMAIERFGNGDLWVWSPVKLDEALKAKARAIRARDGADRSKARADQARKRTVEILRQIEDANTSLAVKLAERSQELDVLRKETRLLRLERDGLLSELAMLRTELDAPSQPTAKTSADREPAATERGGATAAAGKRRENGHARAPTA